MEAEAWVCCCVSGGRLRGEALWHSLVIVTAELDTLQSHGPGLDPLSCLVSLELSNQQQPPTQTTVPTRNSTLQL